MASRIIWGMKWGLLGGSVVGLWAALILMAKGHVDLGVSRALVVLAYPTAGILAGMLTGVARPLLTTRRRCTMAGAVIGVPTATMLMLVALGSPLAWDLGEILGVVFTGGLLGGVAGFKWWTLKDFAATLERDSNYNTGENPRSRRRTGRR